MSEIRVTTLKDTSGGNSSTTSQIASGRAKAFVNFNGAGAVAIRASFNVNSVTDNGGTGDYTVNFATALTDANYMWSSGLTYSTTWGALLFVDNTYPPTTTSLRFYTTDANYTVLDVTVITLTIHR